jgi:hypothetical protein
MSHPGAIIITQQKCALPDLIEARVGSALHYSKATPCHGRKILMADFPFAHWHVTCSCKGLLYTPQCAQSLLVVRLLLYQPGRKLPGSDPPSVVKM